MKNLNKRESGGGDSCGFKSVYAYWKEKIFSACCLGGGA